MKTNYQNTSMLDMVFENRNKNYGAYVLRRDHNKTIQQAMLITFSAMIMFCFGNYLHNKFLNFNSGVNDKETVLNFHDPIKILPAEKKPEVKPKPQNDPPKPKASIANTEKNVVKEEQVKTDSIPTVEDLKKFDPGLTTNLTAPKDEGVPDGKGKGDGLEKVNSDPPAESAPLRWVPVMPEFPGGEKALMKFLQKNTEYPEMEHNLGISGKVTTEFTVNEDGSISDIAVLKSPSRGFDKEVVRVIKILPHFKPGMQNNRPVKVRYVLPFVFREME